MLSSSKKSSVICLFRTFPRYKSSSSITISRGVAMFSRPSAAAFTSIIFRLRRVCVRPSESSSAFTFSMPMRSMMILVAELSLTEIISAATSRIVSRVTPGVSAPATPLPPTRSDDCSVYRSPSLILPQDLLFLLRHFFLRSVLREARHRGPNYEGEQSGKEKAFQHGDLRVSGIIRPNGGARRKALPIIFTVSQEVGWSCRQRYAGAGVPAGKRGFLGY